MKQLLVLAIISFSFLTSYSQESTEQTIDTPKSIKAQFEFIYGKSGNYTQYKVVKQEWFTKLKKQTLDSLKNIEDELKKAELKISEQQLVIQKSERKLQQVNEELVTITSEKDSMPFLGINTTKKSFSTIFWVIVALLLSLLGFFIFKYNRSNTITNEAQSNLKDLEIEFEDHRRRALEREQKVMRKLQDELNKKK